MIDVSRLAYKPGWVFKVGGPLNSMLCVFATTEDSNRPGWNRTTQHMFEIPPTTDDRDFLRWVFARLLECERHEAGEFFTYDGHRPFYPNHQDEGSPYELVERWETSSAETSCAGSAPAPQQVEAGREGDGERRAV